MTISRAPSPKPLRKRSRAAFTLTEAIVAATLGTIAMALLLGVVVTQAKLGLSTGNYADMNEQNRRALTRFDNDMRAATSVTVMTASRVVANVITSMDAGGNPGTTTIEYNYDAAAKTLWRIATTTAVPAVVTRTALITGVESGSIAYLNKDDNVLNLTTPRPLEVKKIMINMRLQRGAAGLTNSDYVVSAVVVMRSRPAG